VLTKILLAALVASLGFNGVQTLQVASERELRVASQARIGALTMLLAGCSARAANLIEDKESDNAVDTLTDDDLRSAPAEWMLSTGASDRDPTAD
jgi:hypothetical protein